MICLEGITCISLNAAEVGSLILSGSQSSPPRSEVTDTIWGYYELMYSPVMILFRVNVLFIGAPPLHDLEHSCVIQRIDRECIIDRECLIRRRRWALVHSTALLSWVSIRQIIMKKVTEISIIINCLCGIPIGLVITS